MVYLRITESTAQAKAFIELAKTLGFVEITEAPARAPRPKVRRKPKKKESALAHIAAGLKDVKKIRAGKAKGLTPKQLLDEM